MKIVTHLSFLALACCCAVFLSACSKSTSTTEPKAEKKPGAKSTMQTAIEGATRKTAVDTGKKAEAKLDAINSKREEDIKELDAF
jgi:hypothetical protein